MTKKLTNVSKICTAYWSLLRCLLNKNIPLIPPLFQRNKFVTDFKEKAELFNSHIATQCSVISNSSKLLSHINYLTDSRLSSVSFSRDKIAKVIQNLDPNKAHGHDNITIHMLKVCGPSIYKHLGIVFNQFIETSVFPSEWKKGKTVPIHEKRDKQILKKHRPVTLLLIFGKSPERLMFNEMFYFFFVENKLNSVNFFESV